MDPARRAALDQVNSNESIDASRYQGFVARDHGKFGSPSLQDGYGDEDHP
jgi:hypothetical protein